MSTTDFGPSQRDLLEEMSLQAEVLDRVSCLLLEKNDSISARHSKWNMFVSQNDMTCTAGLPNAFVKKNRTFTLLALFAVLRAE